MFLNLSRHPFTEDQVTLLQKAGVEFDPTPLNPNFEDGADFYLQVHNKEVVAVAPLCFLLDAELAGISATLANFMPSQAARAAGRFATDTLHIYRIEGGAVKSRQTFTIDKYMQAVEFEPVNRT